MVSLSLSLLFLFRGSNALNLSSHLQIEFEMERYKNSLKTSKTRHCRKKFAKKFSVCKGLKSEKRKNISRMRGSEEVSFYFIVTDTFDSIWPTRFQVKSEPLFSLLGSEQDMLPLGVFLWKLVTSVEAFRNR